MISKVGHGEWETSVPLKGDSDTQLWLIGAPEACGPSGVGGSDSTEKSKFEIQIFNLKISQFLIGGNKFRGKNQHTQTKQIYWGLWVLGCQFADPGLPC